MSVLVEKLKEKNVEEECFMKKFDENLSLKIYYGVSEGYEVTKLVFVLPCSKEEAL